jgi:Tol biopolymer transport system component
MRISLFRMDTNIYIGPAPSSNHAISPQRLSTDNWQSVVNGWTPDSKGVIFESYRNGKWAIFQQAVGDKAAHAQARQRKGSRERRNRVP